MPKSQGVGASTAAALPQTEPVLGGTGTDSELDLFRLDATLNASVVTASGGEQEERSTALADVFSIGRDEIVSRGYRSVGEILADVPGLYVIDDLVTPSLAVRGVNGGLSAGTRIVKVMINGQAVGFRPELTAFLGPELIPIDVVERIEVAKGPLSSLYGANAFLATVNIITRRGKDGLLAELSGRMNVVAGNLGGGGSMAVLYRGEKAWLVGAISGERINRSGVALSQTFDGQKLDKSLLGRPTEADLATPLSLFVSGGVSSAQHGNFVAQVGLQRLDAVNNFRVNSLLTDKSRVVLLNLYSNLHYDKQWQRGGITIDGSYSYGSPDRDYQLQVTGNPAYSFRPNYDYHGALLRVDGSLAPQGERLELRVGVDLEYARETALYYTQTFQTREGNRSPGDQVDLIGASQERQRDYFGIGAYLRLSSRPSQRVAGLRLSAEARVDKIWFGSVSFDPQISFRGGLAYKFSSRVAAKLFGGQAFQTPAGTLLFGYPGPGNQNSVIGNVNLIGGEPLKPQTVNSLEAGFAATPFSRLSLEGSFFFQRLENKVEFLQVGPDFFAANRGLQHNLGFEVMARSSYGRLTGYLWGAFNWSVDKTPQNPPQLYPNGMGALGVDVDIREARVHLHGRVKAVSARGASQSNVYLNNSQPYVLPPYVTLDVTVSSHALHLFGANAETRFLATGRNLTAARYSEPGFGGFDLPNLGPSFLFECKQTL